MAAFLSVSGNASKTISWSAADIPASAAVLCAAGISATTSARSSTLISPSAAALSSALMLPSAAALSSGSIAASAAVLCLLVMVISDKDFSATSLSSADIPSSAAFLCLTDIAHNAADLLCAGIAASAADCWCAGIAASASALCSAVIGPLFLPPTQQLKIPPVSAAILEATLDLTGSFMLALFGFSMLASTSDPILGVFTSTSKSILTDTSLLETGEAGLEHFLLPFFLRGITTIDVYQA